MHTDQLIARLTSELQPVQRLRTPLVRAASWVLAVGVVSATVILATANLGIFIERMSVARFAVEIAATVLTGITAVLAAFLLAVPGRSRHWAWLPVPTLLVWLAASGAGCLTNGLSLHEPGSLLGESGHCFRFILIASAPIAVSLFWMLRRTHPIAMTPMVPLALLATASIAATVLQFYHPFDITWIDLAMHVAAIGLVFVLGAIAGRRIF